MALDSRTITPGIYQHYKGNQYEVLDTVFHSETQELMVLYRPCYGEKKLWVRPFEMFVESIENDGQRVARFKLIEPTSLNKP